jgi:glycosyltransferase involved in cell wall biosynthesis
MTKTVLILSLTPITDEPRVNRQTISFEEKGWNIIACGLKGRAKRPKSWTLWTYDQSGISEDKEGALLLDKKPETQKENTISKAQPSHSLLYKILKKAEGFVKHLPQPIERKFRAFARILVSPPIIHLLLLSRFSDKYADKYYWKNFYYTKLYNALKSQILLSEENSPHLIIAHDYFTAPLADKLAKDFNCKFVVDIHEYANGQYMHSFMWRMFKRPWVKRMQGIYLPKSSFNTTVCEGIAELIAQEYAPLKKPTVIRSTPSYVQMPFKPTGKDINVLYHGIIYETRGIDMVLESLPLWKENFSLTVRGPGCSDYIEHLKNKAKTLKVDHRFKVEPPVLFHQIIPEANKSDIGYFVHEDISAQKRFALPNKFFEYIAAGLALCVSDLPEMARITNEYELGVLVDDYDTKTIARIINSLDAQKIDRYKKNSLEAAKQLCWEHESQNMIDAYEMIASKDNVIF